jgi:hypothetical protein
MKPSYEYEPEARKKMAYNGKAQDEQVWTPNPTSSQCLHTTLQTEFALRPTSRYESVSTANFVPPGKNNKAQLPEMVMPICW